MSCWNSHIKYFLWLALNQPLWSLVQILLKIFFAIFYKNLFNFHITFGTTPSTTTFIPTGDSIFPSSSNAWGMENAINQTIMFSPILIALQCNVKKTKIQPVFLTFFWPHTQGKWLFCVSIPSSWQHGYT